MIVNSKLPKKVSSGVERPDFGGPQILEETVPANRLCRVEIGVYCVASSRLNAHACVYLPWRSTLSQWT
ncbi:hypothetical protein GWI33_006675 [Rhynchophorus ferrugineus]|uniref:Uncharacterized protein n=1 Tax=Rhynchophorus ferrugineus TaxID=354439 RepID=A0A834MIU1_RHYFE|nr:hypothetical protein GWI33_006675 [Rhynchophorus ferrugineus]